MIKIIISACLLGKRCRYDGSQKVYTELDFLQNDPEIELIPICPELLGGLKTPRSPSEIRGERVVNRDGDDVTEAYRTGAEKVLSLAREKGSGLAVLKSRSPSCGSGEIYDGTFSHTLVPGNGICASLLKANGIAVLSELDIERIRTYVEKNT